jgi:SPX domain protein involved in polyphosphate accumulation
MKFGLHLRLLSRSDWRDHYVDYDSLKSFLRGAEGDDGNHSDASIEGSLPSLKSTKPDTGRESSAIAVTFIDMLLKEISKAEDFYILQQDLSKDLLEKARSTVSAVPAVAAADAAISTSFLHAPSSISAEAPAAAASSDTLPSANSKDATPILTAVSSPLVSAIAAAQAAVVAVSDFVDDLRSFSSLNCQAVEKICKKFNKR